MNGKFVEEAGVVLMNSKSVDGDYIRSITVCVSCEAP